MNMIIIGAGECGTRAAFALREAGFSGAVTLIGAEHGLPYERPPLSKPDGDGVQRKTICDQAALEGAGIAYMPGTTIAAIDPALRIVRLADRELPYDKLLIATGAQPRRLTCPGAEHALDFRSHADAARVFAGATGPVAIIGAGLIGMELAAVLRARGLPVTVIELGPAPLGRAVPPRFAARLHQRHETEGVRFHFGQAIAGIDAAGVTLADGTHIPATLTVSAIGVVPDLGLASLAGLAVGNGILINARLQTSDPHIFAAGDCAAIAGQRYETWRNARDQAQIAALNMLGQAQDFAALPWFWSDQYDLGLQVVGTPQDAPILRSHPDGTEIEFHLQGDRLIAAAGLGRGNAVARDIKLAEMLIAGGQSVDAASLADPSVGLKSLLKARKAA
ncbi:NAD(P)/FAD-dependent oxidoreductase [Paracoccus laeviglucosivorans]|uniref:3-phenylpropionate/trans-cinnamate dioxygenase ferredoxin reductase subunit n=1 Tax=Paracoccus laeviglucosivorans TaxID=1197861 RepID=A0A521EBP1_9RHOB|nr:FAD-dependent oxidoreductase [Paracoccus laeviglucosivorans]SMO81222.1 3-phenylpropionate/trans-cinnamate dioxygenase ferredoxin reductase subunit [Paracoccus laeviglucosivorans]